MIDGNYSALMPQRLARATGLIRLDVPTHVSLIRYLRRCWCARDRKGGLEGGGGSATWSMIHHITVTTGTNRRRYATRWDGIALPKIALLTPAALHRFYRSEPLPAR